MKRWKIVLAFAAVFLAGMIAGGFGVMRFIQPPFGHPPSAAKMAAHLMQMLKADLDLSPEQVAKIEPIVSRTTEQTVAFHGELMGRIEDAIDASDREIANCLDSKQKAKFDAIRAKRPRMKHGP